MRSSQRAKRPDQTLRDRLDDAADGQRREWLVSRADAEDGLSVMVALRPLGPAESARQSLALLTLALTSHPRV